MTENRNTEIIAIGTELLLGQIANTNAAWLSEQLAAIGYNVFYHAAVGDNLSRVKTLFHQAQSRSDVVFVTGGLGPTEDDMTRQAFSEMSGLSLYQDVATVKKLEAFFADQQTTMSENNLQQALVFETAVILPNAFGMAPGMLVDYLGTKWVFLPGVPKEMKGLAQEHVFPYLAGFHQEKAVIKSTVLRFSGIGESQLETELKDLIRAQSNPTIAPLVAEEGVTIRLTAKAATEAEALELINSVKKQVLARVGDFFYGEDDQTLTDLVMHSLKVQQKTIAAAESLTGGMFTDRLISIPGASAVCFGGIVSYDTSVKQHVLGVPEEIIEKYGTVSAACAESMASQVRKLLKTDVGIAFTGVAGPDEVEGKAAGTVVIGIASAEDTCTTETFHFSGNRQSVRKQAVLKGMELLYKKLK